MIEKKGSRIAPADMALWTRKTKEQKCVNCFLYYGMFLVSLSCILLSPLPARLRTFPEQKTTALLAVIQNGMIPRGYATEPSPPLQSQIQSRYLFTSEISTEVIWRVLIGYNHSHCPFAALAFRKTNTHKVTLSFTVVGVF